MNISNDHVHEHVQGHGHGFEHADVPVLLVEDDQDIRETLRMALEDEGYVVYEAEDGLEALTMLRNSQTPLIVALDLRLPRLNGDALLLHVSKREHLPAHHCFLLVTANREILSSASLRLMKRMQVRIITKPFDLDDLLNLVANAANELNATAL
ncbi:MAG TPA: response regulator [Ktedonobacterales bacterium]